METIKMELLSDIARVTIQKGSKPYESMIGCDLISRIKQEDPKPKSYKKIKSNNRKKKNKSIY
jgi:hypothetical protein